MPHLRQHQAFQHPDSFSLNHFLKVQHYLSFSMVNFWPNPLLYNEIKCLSLISIDHFSEETTRGSWTKTDRPGTNKKLGQVWTNRTIDP